MWLLFAILSGSFFTASNLLQRYVLRQHKDAWAYSLVFSLVGAIVSLPFMLADPVIPTNITVWMIGLLIGCIIVGHNLLVFKATGLIEASLIGSLGKLRLVWVFLFGILLLGDAFSATKLLGVVCAVVAGILILHHFRRPESMRGISYIFIATLLASAIILLSKYLLDSFNAVSLTFFIMFLPPLILNAVLMPNALRRTHALLRDDWPVITVACSAGALGSLTMNLALALRDATSVVVIGEIFLILVLVGEHIILKEKESVWIKVLSVVLAIVGAILIQL